MDLKNRIITIVVLVLFCISAVCAGIQVANASNPPQQIPTWCYCVVTNDPIGTGQPQNIVFWLNAYPPTASGNYGDRWMFTVVVTKPDGTIDTIGPIKSDPVGAGYTIYTPSQLGNYSVIAKFAGKTIDGTPNGYAPGFGPFSFGYSSINDTYTASQSTSFTFVSQQQAIQAWQEPALPNGYWTTPVNSQNRGWQSIVSNWLGGAAQNNGPTSSFAWGNAPESAHVVWTTPMWSGGIMDARFGDALNYETIHYEGLSFNPIIIDGRIFYNVQSLPREGWYCLNLYTGQVEYFHNTTGAVTGVGGGFDLTGQFAGDALSFGQILNYQSPNQFGGYPYLWSSPAANPFGGAVAAQDWRMFDAYSGNYICSIANTTSPLIVNGQPVMTMGMFGPSPVMIGATGFQAYGSDGSIDYYNVVNTGNATNPKYYLQVWNTSQAIEYKANQDAIAGGTNQYWMWRPFLNYTFDGRQGFSLNVTTVNLNNAGSIQTVREGKYIIGGTAGKNNGTYVQKGQMWALNLDPTKGVLGSLLWNITFTPPQTVVPDVVAGGLFGGGLMSLAGGGLFGGASGVDPEDGVFLFQQTMTRQWWAYSLSTGQQLWVSAPENPWNFYGMSFDIYNGMLISTGGGMSGSAMVAYDIKTGKILWTYSPSQVGFESPYGLYPISISCVADGKIYLYSREHHQIGDIWRGGYWRCVNASNGQELWKLESWGSGQELADGYLVGWNGYDNQIYCMGIGPSKTTLAPVTQGITLGSSIELQGTISDQSYGAPTAAAKLGLQFAAAVSDQDQAAYMQYLYEQQAAPTNAIGVKVHLTAFDPNNNVEDLGYVTSDASGLFHLKWTPPVPGEYKVTASFEGSNSYGPSMATCAVGVDAATAKTSPVVTAAPTSAATTSAPTQAASPSVSPSIAPQPTSGMPTTTYIAIGAAVIIIIAVAAALALRKRK
jgi:hypothetical protein